MTKHNTYDVAIVGGGLAGLAASILIARHGYSVVLFEKETYPFHKVCGEYISNESREFLQQLGVRLRDMRLPQIDHLLLTSPSGNSFTTKLPLGGFGISRYRLDAVLCQLAREQGVNVLEKTRVTDIHFDTQFHLVSSVGDVTAKACCGAFGKRSNLDVKWKRSFLQNRGNHLVNYVGVKYHIKTDWPENVIGLHNFTGGYCGISKIEDDRYCLCYLTTAANLKTCNSNLQQMEEKMMLRNPHLRKIFSNSERCEGFPEAISQISFRKKDLVENHALMLGDAAGMITPLCGNGMSIALHTAKMAAILINEFLSGKITRAAIERSYQQQWKKEFATRLSTGRRLQFFFGSDTLSDLFVSTFKAFPFMASPLIKMTHGKPF